VKESPIVFIGLNPSTADEIQDDPTIRRCTGFAKSWGYNGIWMLNLFGLRSTDPRGLKNHQNPVGPDNFTELLTITKARSMGEVVLCWGNHGAYMGQGDRVTQMLKESIPEKLRAFGWTKTGQPKHPLYLPKTAKLEMVSSLEVEGG
jgi:hypothetical protein